jgi:hypothetical protein
MDFRTTNPSAETIHSPLSSEEESELTYPLLMSSTMLRWTYIAQSKHDAFHELSQPPAISTDSTNLLTDVQSINQMDMILDDPTYFISVFSLVTMAIVDSTFRDGRNKLFYYDTGSKTGWCS